MSCKFPADMLQALSTDNVESDTNDYILTSQQGNNLIKIKRSLLAMSGYWCACKRAR